MRVLGISGSLREGSHNTALLRAAGRVAPTGMVLELYDGLESLPHYNQDRDADVPPAEVTELRRLIERADALLISTPEYNGSIPGALKDALDWASRPRGDAALLNKPVAVIGASISDYGAMWSQDQLRRALGIAGARVLDVELPVGRAAERLDERGELVDAETLDSLMTIMAGLLERDRELQAA
jgi:chromate reductase, NAD(P)H dehydrogenase (quinone)